MRGRPLRDRVSKLFGIGPECRKGMTTARLSAAAAQVRAKAAPGYIPPQRPPSPQARRTNALARATIERARNPATATCHHDGTPGRCPQCRAENDPRQAAKRVIRLVRAERQAARAAYEAYLTKGAS